MTNNNPFKRNKWAIIWAIVNAFLASSLVVLGAFSDGTIGKEGIGLSIVAGLTVFFVQFKQFWDGERMDFEHPKEKIMIGRLI